MKKKVPLLKFCKNVIMLALFAVTVSAMAHFVSAEDTGISVVLDGNAIDCQSYGQNAFIENGRTLVPLRAIFEALGASVEWNERTYTVTSVLGETKIELAIGSNELIRNGTTIIIDVPAKIINERTVVPVRAVSEAFGVKVRWNEISQTVFLSTDPYEKGVICGDTYHSVWHDFNYTPAEGYEFAGSDELLMLTNWELQYDSEYSDFALLPVVYEFSVSDSSGNTMMLVTEKNYMSLTPSEYIEQAMEMYSDENLGADVGKIYDSYIGEIPVKCADVYMSYRGVDIVQCLAVYQKDTRLVSFVISCTDKTVPALLISGFSEYTEPDFSLNTSQDGEDEAIEAFNPVDIPVIEDDTELLDEDATAAKRTVHAYGKFFLGMTKKQAFDAAQGNVNIQSGFIDIWDFENEFEDEDREIIAYDVNCDYISLLFKDGLLCGVYVTTEYVTADGVVEILSDIMEYYGNDYMTDTENNGYIWTDNGGKDVYAGFVHEPEKDLYYCCLYIQIAE